MKITPHEPSAFGSQTNRRTPHSGPLPVEGRGRSAGPVHSPEARQQAVEVPRGHLRPRPFLTTTATVLLAMLPILTRGATKTWDGSSSGNWSAGANWSGGTAPAAGDDLVFPPGITRTNMN